MFESRDQRHMGDRTRARECLQYIAHHRGVNADIFRLVQLAQPCGEKHVGGTKASQSCAKRGWILKVGGDGTDALDIRRWAPCKPKYLPAASAKAAGEVTPNNAAGSDHKRGIRHYGALWLTLGS